MNILICTSHAPWKAEFEDGHGWRVLSAREEAVSYIPQSIVHDEANARLIASAPELLAALNRLVHPMADDEDLSFARDCIANARGK